VNALKFKQIIYLITATVLLTVAAQVYTNVQNYQVNKQRFELDVQQALDLAVETYYADRARNEVFVFTGTSTIPDSLLINNRITVSGNVAVDSVINFSTSIQASKSWNTYIEKRDSISSEASTIALNMDSTTIFKLHPDSIEHIEIVNNYSPGDSSELQLMAKKILASLSSGINFEKLEFYLAEELSRKSIDVDYVLIHTTSNKVYRSDESDVSYELVTFSKSTYLPRTQTLAIEYENASLIILKRGAFDLLISLLIISAVLGSLLYLYRVINEQKALAEIKNDLISNITHEFKTPIATISTAIEGISIFNEANDPVKTKKYLGISSDQLKKLNGMVEKLLETASLDSDEIELSKEEFDAVEMTKKLIDKFDVIKGEKSLRFESELAESVVELDAFHMENALSNLIDNALKYGGESVSVSLRSEGEQTIWEVKDNGGGLDKQQQVRIFEKFYRVPTGNVHDVKGFGIGLYYTKTMVEKHGGSIRLDVSPNETKFSIIV